MLVSCLDLFAPRLVQKPAQKGLDVSSTRVTHLESTRPSKTKLCWILVHSSPSKRHALPRHFVKSRRFQANLESKQENYAQKESATF